MSRPRHAETPPKSRVPAVVWSALIAVASLARFSASQELPGMFEHADKAVHFGMYALYAVILLRCGVFTAQGPLTPPRLTIAWGISYGFLMECLQGLIPWLQRDFSGLDTLANVLGVTAGAWAWSLSARAGVTQEVQKR